jgi:hypothetical protein
MIRRPGGLAGLAAAGLLVAACGATAPTPAVDPGDFMDVPGVGRTRIDVPRPSGAVSAPCDDDPLPPSTDETTTERVAALRAAGLFADREGVADTDLAAEIDQRLQARWGDDLAPDDPIRDLAVAEQDAARVLWIDLEADVVGGNDVYVSTLEQLDGISLGAFEPAGISETWAAEEGPITVAFELGDGRHELQPAYLEDWIDPGILVGINALITDAGRRFELYRAFDQSAVVLALTDVERQALEARGWCFE